MKLIYRLMIGLALVVMNAGVTMAENQMATQIKSQIKASGLEEEIWDIIDLSIVAEDDNAEEDAGYKIISPREHYLFAKDGAGGEFYVLGDGRILYLSSEGEILVCGRNFKEFISITTSISSWADAIRFIPMQDPKEAASAWQRREEKFKADLRLLDGSVDRFDEIDRQKIRTYFDAPYIEQAFLALYNVARTASADVKVAFEGEDVPLLQNEKDYPFAYLIP